MRIQIHALLLACVSVCNASGPEPNFSRDVLPILQTHCQQCHRPGEVAPMPFLTYRQTRPWAKAIREAVVLKKMPPWFAEPGFGPFANDRSLSPQEIETLVKWAESGAPEGDPRDAPPGPAARRGLEHSETGFGSRDAEGVSVTGFR